MSQSESYFRSIVVYLPDLNGKSVLQLANEESLVKVFEEHNVKHVSSVELTDLANFSSNGQKFDLIILNKRFTELSEQQSLEIVELALRHLNEGGHFFFTELCFEQTNKTPINFIDLVQSKEFAENDSVKYGFDLVFAKSSNSFANKASNLVSFLFTRIKLENFHGFKTLKEFMDHKQYTRNGVLRYEKIFGAGFVSTGGIDTTSQFFRDYLDLKPGQVALDVGCGIGGGDFLMAQTFPGVKVLGLDLASNMVAIAWERYQSQKNLDVSFEIGDVTKQKFPSNSFDLIYSRDTILHIQNKEALFAQFKDWLKPGGKIFITDYCCGPKPWSDEFTGYVEQRGYDLRTVDEYGNIFSRLGFRTVKALDVTNLFVESLNNELCKMNQIKDDFLREFSEEDFQYLIDGWKAKLVRCAEGFQKWGLFYCEK